MADQKHFIISDKCSLPQRKVFEAINRGLDEFGISPEEFDNAFRIQLMKQCLMVPVTSRVSFIDKLDAKSQREFFNYKPEIKHTNEDNRRRYMHVMGGTRDHFIETTLPETYYTPQEAYRILENIEGPSVTACRTKMIEGFNKIAGPFQDINPETFSPSARQLYDNFFQEADPKFKPHYTEHGYRNIVQQYADGKMLDDRKGDYWEWDVFGSQNKRAHFETAPFNYYITNAVINALRTAIVAKEINISVYERKAEQINKDILIAMHTVTGHMSTEDFGAYLAEQEAAKRAVEQAAIAAALKAQQELEAAAQRAIAATQLQEEGLLKHSPYGVMPGLRGIADRATRTTSPPEITLRETWQQIEPLCAELNRNFTPHLRLGNALFKDKDSEIVRILDYIGTGKNKGTQYKILPNDIDLAKRAEACNAMLDILATPIEQLAPELKTAGIREQLIENNRLCHEAVMHGLPKAPILVIAALGNKGIIDDARAWQDMLFPADVKNAPSETEAHEYRKELEVLAAQSLENAFHETGRAIPPSLASVIEDMKAPLPEPLLPVKPTVTERVKKPVIIGDARAWDEIRASADKFVDENLAQQPPYDMFKCSLGMQPGHTLTLSLSRWVGNNGQRHSEEHSCTLQLKEPSLENALAMKKQLQSHIFNTKPIVEYRRLHSGNYISNDDNFLPKLSPTPDPIRPEPDGTAGRIIKRDGVYCTKFIFPAAENTAEKIETIIPLGVSQSGDFNDADKRRLQVLDYLAEARADNDHVTSQDLRMRLQDTVIAGQGQWQRADTIDLKEHEEIARVITVRFPYSESKESTTLNVKNPELQGTPTPFWTIPVSIRMDGKEIAQTRVNTHIVDTDMAMNRIAEITNHLKSGLEKYAADHPDSTWEMGLNQRLAQLKEVELNATDNIDWTRLDRIKDELGYVRQLSVHLSESQNIANGQAEFSLSIRRADGSPFFEERDGVRHAEPVERKFFTGASSIDAETFRSQVHARFVTAMEEAYRPDRDPAFETIASDTPLRKALEQYNARSITNMFDGAVRDVSAQVNAAGQTITKLSKASENIIKSAGNVGLANEEAHHHLPFSQRYAASLEHHRNGGSKSFSI